MHRSFLFCTFVALLGTNSRAAYMRICFSRPQRPHTLYVQQSYRDKNGKSTSRKIETLGTEEEIEAKYGCPDGLEWAKAYVAELNEQAKLAKRKVKIELSPSKRIPVGEQVLYSGGDLMLLPMYNKLGLNEACKSIVDETKAKYNLAEILEALVMLRVLYPCSKRESYKLNQKRLRRTTFAIEDMYRALSLLSSHIDGLQAEIWKNSNKVMKRNTRVIYYDCTNYYFEIEDNDLPFESSLRHSRRQGIRRRGKSKEHRPNPIVQMGLLMNTDGIPLSFIIFPGNESEQPSLQKIEEMIADKFGLNEFVISTDAGLSSEDNRRYNMTEGREYIAVQSLPMLPAGDQAMALDPHGWHVAFRDGSLSPINPENPAQDTFNLDQMDWNKELHTRFYKEILVEKRLGGRKNTTRQERVIVTYSHDFALYLKHKREERLALAEKIVRNKNTKSRLSQQDPRKYVQTTYVTADGEPAENIAMSVNWDAVDEEARFDGFYAYGTSLDDDAVDVLKARNFHHEIEHLFHTTKTHLEARPVFLQREDRIRTHFLICFIAMTLIKMLQKQLDMPDLSVDRLISELRGIRFGYFKGIGYRPEFERNELTDKLQELAGIQVDTEIIPQKTMNRIIRSVKGG